VTAPEPTIADVLARLDVLALEVRAGFAEQRSAVAELRVELVAVRQSIDDLEHAVRDLWDEHLGHSHPTEGSG
jgi:uncharacterized coiled-coil protein SlyX